MRLSSIPLVSNPHSYITHTTLANLHRLVGVFFYLGTSHMSTSTLLQTANVIFRAIGERPVLTLSTTQGDRVKDCIAHACTDIETLHTWDWLCTKRVANSWVLGTADIGTYQRLFDVSYGSPAKGYKVLQYVPEVQLDTMPRVAYTGTSTGPTVYSISAGKVLFAKYPNDIVSQGRILFYLQEPIILPTLDTDVFPNIPERYMSLIHKKACHLMNVRYLDDAQAASYFQQELEQLVQQYRNYERKAPVGHLTMHRKGRR
jgi:hypothetical protein